MCRHQPAGTFLYPELFKDSKHYQDVANWFFNYYAWHRLLQRLSGARMQPHWRSNSQDSHRLSPILPFDTCSRCFLGLRKTQQVMPTKCSGVSLLEAPRAW